jgi:hypothetical protein
MGGKITPGTITGRESGLVTLTIELPDEQTAVLAAKARAQGLSSEEYARKLLAQELTPSVFEQGLGMFGSPEDAALIDEVVSIAYEERRRPTRPEPSLE